MHGRIKVRSSDEQKALKRKEQEKKLAAYRSGMDKILSNRRQDSYDPENLQLSALILTSNPDVYTLWNYRKEAILIEIKSSVTEEEKVADFLENELKLTERCLQENPKSYGAWHHRFWSLGRHPRPDWPREFTLCTKYLALDDRNFHCWDYRRLLVDKIGASLGREIDFSTERLNVNFSNYSSWHYRSTLRRLDENCAEIEVDLVKNAVFTDPGDSSAWFYLKWVLSSPLVKGETLKGLWDCLGQLGALEPDCKWVVLGKCWLVGCLGIGEDERVDFCKKLAVLDPLRKKRYEECVTSGLNKI